MGQFGEEEREAVLRHWGSTHICGCNIGHALVLALAISVTACAGDRFVTTEAFRDTKRLETELKKGRSTKEDVKRVLGEPTGSGAVFMPGVQHAPQEMWFYQDIELTDIKGSKGQLDLKVRQQILVVILRNGLFDGFMWFSNAETATGWVKDSLRGTIGQ